MQVYIQFHVKIVTNITSVKPNAVDKKKKKKKKKKIYNHDQLN